MLRYFKFCYIAAILTFGVHFTAISEETVKFSPATYELLKKLESNQHNSISNYRHKLEDELENASSAEQKTSILKSLLIYDVEYDQNEALDRHIEELRELSNISGDKSGLIIAGLFKYYSLFYKNINEESWLLALNEISEERAKYNNVNIDILHHILLSISFTIHGDYFASLEEINIALLLEGEDRYGEELELFTLWALAYLNVELNNISEAATFYSKSVDFSLSKGLPVNIGTAIHNMTIVLSDFGSIDEAHAYYALYEKIAKSYSSEDDIVASYYSLAINENRRKNYQKSHEYAVLALDKLPVNSWQMYNTLQADALNLASMGELDQAKEKIDLVRGYYNNNPLQNQPRKNWILYRAEAEVLLQSGQVFQAVKILDENQSRLIEATKKNASDRLTKALNQINEGIRERSRKEAVAIAAKKNREIIYISVAAFLVFVIIAGLLQLKTMKKLAAAKKDAEKESFYKSEYLANMSHELRTPLNAIIGYSEFMMMESDVKISYEKTKEYLGDINESGMLLLSLINDVLDLSKISAGEVELQKNIVVLDEVIQSVRMILWPSLSKKEQDCHVEISGNLPKLRGDIKIIKQIMINLLSNAHKYSPPKSEIKIDARLTSENQIQFSVSDQGHGMDEEEVKIALQPFTQIKSPYIKSEKGTGLGLPLVNELTRLHQATLKIASKPNVGTNITVTFPEARTVLAE